MQTKLRWGWHSVVKIWWRNSGEENEVMKQRRKELFGWGDAGNRAGLTRMMKNRCAVRAAGE